jgi:NTP pyrophosphatase (non-canonical NTP hydrolase)
LADVFFVLICIANQTGINLETALEKNLKKKSDRDNKRHIDNIKLK